jgi:type III secretion protein R
VRSLVTLLAQTQPAAQESTGVHGSTVLVLLVAGATFVPFVVLVGTSFVKISVVLALVRNAFGAAQVPSSMVVTGLAAVLTFHVMAPTLTAVASAAGPHVDEAMRGDATPSATSRALSAAWDAARPPLQRFLRANTEERDRRLFFDLAQQSRAAQAANGAAAVAVQSDDISVLLPAFAITELTRAFAIGFLVLLPFLLLELVLASMITSLGLTTLSASTVSLPFKLLLFVFANGWYLVTRALVLGYR